MNPVTAVAPSHSSSATTPSITGGFVARTAVISCEVREGVAIVCAPTAVVQVSNTAPAARPTARQRCLNGSPGTISEVIEQSHAIGFGPDADLARILECIVVPFDRFLAVKGNGEVIVLKINSQRVPLVGSHLHARPLLFGASALDGVVDRNVVF